MGLETRKRVGRLYREGFFQKDDVAKQWSIDYPEEVVEEKPEKKEKSKKSE